MKGFFYPDSTNEPVDGSLTHPHLYGGVKDFVYFVENYIQNEEKTKEKGNGGIQFKPSDKPKKKNTENKMPSMEVSNNDNRNTSVKTDLSTIDSSPNSARSISLNVKIPVEKLNLNRFSGINLKLRQPVDEEKPTESQSIKSGNNGPDSSAILPDSEKNQSQKKLDDGNVINTTNRESALVDSVISNHASQLIQDVGVTHNIDGKNDFSNSESRIQASAPKNDGEQLPNDQSNQSAVKNLLKKNKNMSRSILHEKNETPDLNPTQNEEEMVETTLQKEQPKKANPKYTSPSMRKQFAPYVPSKKADSIPSANQPANPPQKKKQIKPSFPKRHVYSFYNSEAIMINLEDPIFIYNLKFIIDFRDVYDIITIGNGSFIYSTIDHVYFNNLCIFQGEGPFLLKLDPESMDFLFCMSIHTQELYVLSSLVLNDKQSPAFTNVKDFYLSNNYILIRRENTYSLFNKYSITNVPIFECEVKANQEVYIDNNSLYFYDRIGKTLIAKQVIGTEMKTINDVSNVWAYNGVLTYVDSENKIFVPQFYVHTMNDYQSVECVIVFRDTICIWRNRIAAPVIETICKVGDSFISKKRYNDLLNEIEQVASSLDTDFSPIINSVFNAITDRDTKLKQYKDKLISLNKVYDERMKIARETFLIYDAIINQYNNGFHIQAISSVCDKPFTFFTRFVEEKDISSIIPYLPNPILIKLISLLFTCLKHNHIDDNICNLLISTLKNVKFNDLLSLSIFKQLVPSFCLSLKSALEAQPENTSLSSAYEHLNRLIGY